VGCQELSHSGRTLVLLTEMGLSRDGTDEHLLLVVKEVWCSWPPSAEILHLLVCCVDVEHGTGN
jgi:hypothetical protein